MIFRKKWSSIVLVWYLIILGFVGISKQDNIPQCGFVGSTTQAGFCGSHGNCLAETLDPPGLQCRGIP